MEKQKDIQTDRLRIRPFLAADFQDYYELLREPTNLMLAGQPIPKNSSEGRDMLGSAILQQTFALELRSTQKVIGLVEQQARFTGQPPVPDPAQIQIGYLLNKHYRRQGYMTEALQAIIKLFQSEQYQQVWAAVFTDNEASIQLLRHLGFSYQFTLDLSLEALGIEQQEHYYLLKIK